MRMELGEEALNPSTAASHGLPRRIDLGVASTRKFVCYAASVEETEAFQFYDTDVYANRTGPRRSRSEQYVYGPYCSISPLCGLAR